MKSLSRAWLFAIPWTVAGTKLLCPWDSQGKSTGVGCHFLLQGIFPTQGSNPGLSHCRQTLYRLNHQGSPIQTIIGSWHSRKTEPCPNHHMWSESELNRVRLFVTPWTVAHQSPLSMGFSRQEYWSGLPFPSPGDFPNPGIEPWSPALQADDLPSELWGKPLIITTWVEH